MQYSLSLAIAAALSLLAACSPTPTASAEQLVGPEWLVQDINSQGIIDNSRITLNFDVEGRLHGRSGCNQYTGSYSVEDELRIGPLAQTKMACPSALMNQEQRFTQLLGEVNSFSLSETGALVLRTADGKTITARKQ